MAKKENKQAKAQDLVDELTKKRQKLQGMLRDAGAATGIVKTLAEVAQYFGVTPRYVSEWKARGCPGFTPGAYDLKQIEVWKNENIQTLDRTADTDDARARRATAEADLAELKAAQARGALMRWKDAAEIMEAYIAEAKSHLEQLPDWLMSVVEPPRGRKRAVRQQVRQRIHEILADLTAMMNELADREKQKGRSDAA